MKFIASIKHWAKKFHSLVHLTLLSLKGRHSHLIWKPFAEYNYYLVTSMSLASNKSWIMNMGNQLHQMQTQKPDLITHMDWSKVENLHFSPSNCFHAAKYATNFQLMQAFCSNVYSHFSTLEKGSHNMAYPSAPALFLQSHSFPENKARFCPQNYFFLKILTRWLNIPCKITDDYKHNDTYKPSNGTVQPSHFSPSLKIRVHQDCANLTIRNMTATAETSCFNQDVLCK